MEINSLLHVLPWEVQLVLAAGLLLLFSIRFSCETFSVLEEFLHHQRLQRYLHHVHRKYTGRLHLRMRPRKKYHHNGRHS